MITFIFMQYKCLMQAAVPLSPLEAGYEVCKAYNIDVNQTLCSMFGLDASGYLEVRRSGNDARGALPARNSTRVKPALKMRQAFGFSFEFFEALVLRLLAIDEVKARNLLFFKDPAIQHIYARDFTRTFLLKYIKKGYEGFSNLRIPYDIEMSYEEFMLFFKQLLTTRYFVLEQPLASHSLSFRNNFQQYLSSLRLTDINLVDALVKKIKNPDLLKIIKDKLREYFSSLRIEDINTVQVLLKSIKNEVLFNYYLAALNDNMINEFVAKSYTLALNEEFQKLLLRRAWTIFCNNPDFQRALMFYAGRIQEINRYCRRDGVINQEESMVIFLRLSGDVLSKLVASTSYQLIIHMVNLFAQVDVYDEFQRLFELQKHEINNLTYDKLFKWSVCYHEGSAYFYKVRLDFIAQCYPALCTILKSMITHPHDNQHKSFKDYIINHIEDDNYQRIVREPWILQILSSLNVLFYPSFLINCMRYMTGDQLYFIWTKNRSFVENYIKHVQPDDLLYSSEPKAQDRLYNKQQCILDGYIKQALLHERNYLSRSDEMNENSCNINMGKELLSMLETDLPFGRDVLYKLLAHDRICKIIFSQNLTNDITNDITPEHKDRVNRLRIRMLFYADEKQLMHLHDIEPTIFRDVIGQVPENNIDFQDYPLAIDRFNHTFVATQGRQPSQPVARTASKE